MIIATLIASVDDSKVHCEWYDADYSRYQAVREKIKQFLNEKSFMSDDFEVLTIKGNLILQ